MTDGIEESHSDVDGVSNSQGSLDQILVDLVNENEAAGYPFNVFPGSMNMQEISSDTLAPGALASSVLNESNEVPIAVKFERGARDKSPDSGYSFVHSNESPRNDQISNVTMYEIPAQPVGATPARSNFPGDYGFQAVFPGQSHVPKGVNYTYSPLLGKLYAKMNTTICMQFKCMHNPPHSAIIRGMLLFQKPEHINETVCRCQTHLFKDNASDLAHHVLQIQDSGNTSMQSPAYNSGGGQFSVSTPYKAQLRDEPFVVPYVFTCLSTCIGGINRRPLLAVFTLEDGHGVALGSVTLGVKICSCPGRDRPKEEERKRKQETGETATRQNSLAQLPRKRRREEYAGQGYKFLRVKEENYSILSQINDALNLASLTTDQQRSQYQEEEQNNSWKELLAKFCRDNFH